MNDIIVKSIKHVNYLTIAVALTATQNCVAGAELVEESTCRITIDGQTDQDGLDKIKHATCDAPSVKISSAGGDANMALEIADEIRRRQATLVIDQYCFSSCAEFLLPAAKGVNFINRPLIGFHGNPAMKEWLAEWYDVPNLEFCRFETVDRMYDLYFESGTEFGFWHRQLTILSLEEFVVDSDIMSGTCPNMGFNFQHEMWFPNSETLRNELGLNFSGSVCADDVESCAVRVRALFPGRGTFVIDDVVIDTESQ